MPDDIVASEEDIVQGYFAPLARDNAGALGLQDDCALFAPTPGTELVLKIDPIVAGVHFLPDDAAADIAWKALAVNVSDLAAKGATPRVYLMAVAFPEAPRRSWLASFAVGLKTAQTRFGIALAGGDTDRAPGPLSISITVVGEVPKGRMVRRGGARPGDVLLVSGTIGDAHLGLELRTGRLAAGQAGMTDADAARFEGRYLRPEPRLPLAPVLLRHATAAMDVSDGLIKDADRMARAAGLALKVRAHDVPLSDAARAWTGAQAQRLLQLLAGGDDYEILAAIRPQHVAEFSAAAAVAGVPVTVIGDFAEGAPGLVIEGVDGTAMTPPARTGWDHFRP